MPLNESPNQFEGEGQGPEQHFEQDDKQPNKGERMIIVGIGASAGGLAALQDFFDTMSADSGMAFVVVTHTDPERESLLPELLQRHTEMPVRQVEEMAPVEANHVYVMSPDRRIVITDTHLDSEHFEEPHGRRRPIDFFFRGLADAHGNGAVAVILSGGGTDGAVGIKAIKEHGGLLMAQQPDEAEYDSMPRAAIATGLVDVVLPVHQLAQRLVAYRRNGVRLPLEENLLTAGELEAVSHILTQVQVETGNDLSRYKRSTILRRIQRRMQLHGQATLPAYLDYLRHTPGEAQALFNDLLIGVTNFFRDKDAWQALVDQVVPRLFEGKGQGDMVRAWSIGCATGEEAYTIAILLLEYAATLELPPSMRPSLQVFASDLDDAALNKARTGLYPEAIEADVSHERLQRFFDKEGHYYRVRRGVRNIVLFANHSVLRDPPFAHLDLISCRNLLIYLQRELQQNVFQIFHYALNPERYLFLGTSESMETVQELFRTVDKSYRIYQGRPSRGEHPEVPTLPLMVVRSAERQHLPAWAGSRSHLTREAAATVGAYHMELLEKSAPPSVLVDKAYHVIHLSERAGRYLLHPGGEVTSDLLKLVRPELRFELRSALHQAFEQNRTVVGHAVSMQFSGAAHRVTIAVQPKGSNAVDEEEPLALVFFLEDEGREAGLEGAQEGSAVAPGVELDEEAQALVAKLEAEVQWLRERLQATVEEYQSANEELQSINEEYRSTTEELETSKEELQSVNEELQTVNAELKNKLEEVSRAHSDLENLMASTDIATLFLDRELRIQRYTPAAAELFNIMPGDHGRPIGHLTGKLAYDSLAEDARRVLRNLVPVEHEVQARPGGEAEERWFLARLRPYRTVDDRIDGVVLTFVDFSERKKTEEALRQSEARLSLEVAALERLHQMTGQVVTAAGMQEALDEILNAAVELLQADTGNIQLLDQQRQTLEIVAERGFQRPFLDTFGLVGAGDPSACGRALQKGGRVVIEDVETDKAYEPYRKAAQAAGYRAVQSTPLVSHRGEILGVLSTHWSQSHALSTRDERLLDLLARHAADLLEHLQSEKALEQRVRERTQEVEALASQLTMAEHEERGRIAQILHDDLQQQLYSAQIQLSFLRDEAADETLLQEITEMEEALSGAIETARQLSVDLSPPILGGEELTEIIAWLATQMREQYRLEVELEADGSFPVPERDRRVLVFQLVRELLFNVVKHAQVERVHVRLQEVDDPEMGGAYRIDVVDEGAGFEPEEVLEVNAAPNRRGLRHAGEQLRLIGGRIEVVSAPGAGTRATITVPPAAEAEARREQSEEE